MSHSVIRPPDGMQPCPVPLDLAPPDYCDPVIEAYKKDVDRTLLRQNLRLTVEERIRKAQSFHEAIEELRQAGKRSRLERRSGDRQ
jgi:hypothetical protein